MNSKKKKTDFTEYSRRCEELIAKKLSVQDTLIAMLEIASEYDFSQKENSGEQRD